MDQYSIISRITHYFDIDELFKYKSISPQFHDVCKSKLHPYETNKWFRNHLRFTSNNLELGNQWLKQKGIFDKINGLHFTIQLYDHQMGITIRSIFNKKFSFVIPFDEVVAAEKIFRIKCEMLDLPIADKTKTILWITFGYPNLVFMVLIEINLPMLMKHHHCYYLVEQFNPGKPSYGESERKHRRISLFHTKHPDPRSHRRFIFMLYKMYPELNNCPVDDWILTNKYLNCVQQKNRTFIYNSQNGKSYDGKFGKITVCQDSETKHFKLKRGRLFVINGRWIIVHDLSFNKPNDPNVFVYDYKQDFKVIYNFHLNQFDVVRMFDHYHLLFAQWNYKNTFLFNLKTNQKIQLPNISFEVILNQSTIINNHLYYFELDQFDKDKILTKSLNLKQMIINNQIN
jgi:hypothetical protein